MNTRKPSPTPDWQIVAETLLFLLIAAVCAWPMISAIDAILKLI